MHVYLLIFIILHFSFSNSFIKVKVNVLTKKYQVSTSSNIDYTDMNEIHNKGKLKYNLTNISSINWANTNEFINNLNKFTCPTTNYNFTLPFMDVESLGIKGRWIEDSGNYLLPPSNNLPPIGVIHFLGGAFVGAAPHLTYKYLLESLSDQGYVIVATPYKLSFDYLSTCDDILTKFDHVGAKLASMYGPIPVIGLGHSCGSLLQLLITSLFPDAPRASNILISFNNKPAKESIPLFEEIIIPFAEQIMSDTNSNSKNLRNLISYNRNIFNNIVDNYGKSSITPIFMKNEIIPLFKQSIEILDQFPPLLKMISNGKREFDPTPIDTKEVCKRMYRARSTLLIKFDNDNLDESNEILTILVEANKIMKELRPNINMEVELVTLTGTHITPLTQNIYYSPIINISNDFQQELRNNFLKTIDNVNKNIISFLDKYIKSGLA